jgi:hypothetical protein
MDEDGNTNKEQAIKYILALREPIIKGAKDNNTVDRFISERPLTVEEAAIILSGNIFPKKLLIDHLNYIRLNSKIQGHKQVGTLDFDSTGTLK